MNSEKSPKRCTCTRIKSKTKADPQSIDAKKYIIKGRRTKKGANQQTPTVETLVANIDIEMEITSNLTEYARNIPATAVEIRH